MYKLGKKELELREKLRGKYPPDLRWYAVVTHYGREHRVRERILSDFVNDGVAEVLVPELKSGVAPYVGRKTRPEILFNCYVFLRCTMNETTYATVTAYDVVYSILGRAYRIPSVIDDTEMTHLKGVLASRPAPILSPRLNIGSTAEVTRGLMEGMRGRVVEYNASFVKLEASFSFFENGTSIIAAIPLSDIRLE